MTDIFLPSQSRAEKHGWTTLRVPLKRCLARSLPEAAFRMSSNSLGTVTIASLCVLLPISFILASIVRPETIGEIAREDGPIENVGAFFFLLSSIMFLILYFRSAEYPNRFFSLVTQRNVYLLCLAAVCFLAFGEEISWGQRVFGWGTPEGWRLQNLQGETNIHNLWFVSRWAGSSLWLQITDATHLFSAFWFFYGIVIPVACLASKRVEGSVTYAGVPIPPLPEGLLLGANYFLAELFVHFFVVAQDSVVALYEVKETNYAIIVASIALGLWSRKGPDETACRRNPN
ncbi:MAG: hypothetical protein ACRED5_15780 [Propylenella sp.]